MIVYLTTGILRIKISRPAYRTYMNYSNFINDPQCLETDVISNTLILYTS